MTESNTDISEPRRFATENSSIKKQQTSFVPPSQTSTDWSEMVSDTDSSSFNEDGNDKEIFLEGYHFLTVKTTMSLAYILKIFSQHFDIIDYKKFVKRIGNQITDSEVVLLILKNVYESKIDPLSLSKENFTIKNMTLKESKYENYQIILRCVNDVSMNTNYCKDEDLILDVLNIKMKKFDEIFKGESEVYLYKGSVGEGIFEGKYSVSFLGYKKEYISIIKIFLCYSSIKYIKKGKDFVKYLLPGKKEKIFIKNEQNNKNRRNYKHEDKNKNGREINRYQNRRESGNGDRIIKIQRTTSIQENKNYKNEKNKSYTML